MNKILNIISKIVCVVLSGLLLCIMCICITLNIFSKICNTQNISEIVSSLDSKTIMGEEEINKMYETATLAGINTDTIEKIIESKHLKKLVGKAVGNSLEWLLYGKNAEIIAPSDVVSTVENYLNEIARDFDIVITADERNTILHEVELAAEEMVSETSIEELAKEELTEEELNTIRFIFGGALENILWIVIFILIAIIALCRWSIYRFAIWTGVTTILTGLFFVLLSLGFTNIIAMQDSIQITPDLLNAINNNVLNIITKEGIIMLIIGIVQIGYYAIMKKRKSI